MTALSVIVVTTWLSLCHSQGASNNVNVEISLGTVIGLHVITGHIEYNSFRGIPYANATTRFKAPTPIKRWKSVVMATEDGPACPQLTSPQEPFVEECLFLNVYSPQLPQPDNVNQPKLPVMVFIHGGGFIGGSSSSLLYGPEFFMATKNVILVTFNYRLGIFGFLSTGTRDAQGNAGMKDQVEAMRWVVREISYFGGDPACITIFGESAGAASVIHHILSPMSKGLFHRGIAESGSALADWAYIDTKTAREYATTVARNLGCDTKNTKTVVKCLREMPASKLVEASYSLSLQAFLKEGFILLLTPVIEIPFNEEVFLPTSPVTEIKYLSRAVPLLIGTNKDEGMLLLTDDDNQYAYINSNLQILAPRSLKEQETTDQLDEFAQLVREYYFNNGSVNRTTLKGYVDVITDKMFVYPTAQTVRALVQKGSVVYLYHFVYSGGYKTPQPVADKLGYEGVTHAEELGYLFYSTAVNNTDLTQTTTQDYQTMQRMVKLWIAFATTGAPSNSNDEVIEDIYWPRVTRVRKLDYLEMNTSFTAAKGYYKERIALWDRLTSL